MRFLIIMALISLLILAACGGGDDDSGDSDAGDAGDFAVELIEQRLSGQAGRSWDSLVAEQQAVVSRDAYIQCESTKSYPDLDVEVVETYDETVPFPRVGDVDATAVTVEMSNDETSVKNTIHLVNVDGQWRWSLLAEDIDTYETGECPN